MKKTILLFVSVLIWTQMLSFAQSTIKYPLKVGAAKIDITPSNFPVAPATGKYDHERLFVRAIVLDNGTTRTALISFECRITADMWADVYKRIMAELNCPIENIIISDTHTHSNNRIPAPGKTNGANVAAGTTADVQAMANGIVEAVRQAKGKLQPALMGFGKGASYLNVNRDVIDADTRKWTQAANLDGWSDKSVDVIKFETPGGKPIAVYMNYAMHPVNGFVLGVYSADVPGAVSRYVEKAFNDEIVVAYTQGAQGDQNPLYLRASTNGMASRAGNKITGYELNREENEGPLRMVSVTGSADPKLIDVKVLDDLFRFIESEGQVLGEEVIRVMTVTKKMTGDVYISCQQKVVNCPGRKRIGGDNMDPATREGVAGVYEDGPDAPVKMGVIGIGTAAIVWVNGEVFNYIAQRVKKEVPLTNTMFVGIANAGAKGAGYIPNDAAYGEQVFQVLNTPFKPGCAERAIVNTLVEMQDKYLMK